MQAWRFVGRVPDQHALTTSIRGGVAFLQGCVDSVHVQKQLADRGQQVVLDRHPKCRDVRFLAGDDLFEGKGVAGVQGIHSQRLLDASGKAVS